MNSLVYVDKEPQTDFDQIIEKYTDMNIAYPFCEDNGRPPHLTGYDVETR